MNGVGTTTLMEFPLDDQRNKLFARFRMREGREPQMRAGALVIVGTRTLIACSKAWRASVGRRNASSSTTRLKSCGRPSTPG
jgi:hypothetical protein